MKLNIDIQVASSGESLPDASRIERWVRAVFEHKDLRHQHEAELSIRIVDADEGHQLNRQYRGKDKPTNVLSFPADLPEGIDLPLIGDIVVCAPVVAQEAQEQDKTLESHWAHMIVHGTLHLLGYDHVNESDAQVMETTESDIITSMNYPSPYEQEPVNQAL